MVWLITRAGVPQSIDRDVFKVPSSSPLKQKQSNPERYEQGYICTLKYHPHLSSSLCWPLENGHVWADESADRRGRAQYWNALALHRESHGEVSRLPCCTVEPMLQENVWHTLLPVCQSFRHLAPIHRELITISFVFFFHLKLTQTSIHSPQSTATKCYAHPWHVLDMHN